MNFTLIPTISTAFFMAASVAAEDAAPQDFTDLTIPEFSKPTDDQTEYVDMQKLNGRFCPDHPFRPGWVMVQPRGYQWKTGLMQDYYYLQRSRAVVAAGQCSCDLMFPSWDDMRPELEQLLAQLPDDSASEFTPDQGRQLREIERAMQQEKRAIASEFGQLCQTIIMGE
ncbi:MULTISPECIES: hypothetical protein [Roseobacteraceae]|uniref:Uncharacterized protein n=1 Tax=Pseudosulfitobacter pseudonitzschiae TaxID=1402135 RepID=A0A221K1T4_9RHOB|nr:MULTISPECIES: hypothetical protein [Roseobacteraceae]ASM72931.1 hypothetical protein SULPSESMR1_02130 [Pseudosulfitobacter pseudonitzschiae]